MNRTADKVCEPSGSSPLADMSIRRMQRPTSIWILSAVVAASLVGCLAIGMMIGGESAGRSAHVAGACIALDMAEAHGAMDEPRRKRIIYSLVNVASPYTGRFTMTLSEMLKTCTDLRMSASSHGN